MVLGEEGNTVVVAELADGDEGARLEIIEDVANLGLGGEFRS